MCNQEGCAYTIIDISQLMVTSNSCFSETTTYGFKNKAVIINETTVLVIT